MWQQFSGLTSAEVKKLKQEGLINYQLDQQVTTYYGIVFRNIFNLINVLVSPLVVMLIIYELYLDALAFAVFLIINTLTSLIDEIRIKRQLDKLKTQFQRTARVIRDNQLQEIPVSEIVLGDFVYATEGDSIVTDGEVVGANYLQLDESMLTGESDYLGKSNGDKVMAGGFVVTGQCVYEVTAVGKQNYLNQLSSAALGSKGRSRLQVNGDKLIGILVVAALVSGVVNFAAATWAGAPAELKLLGLTTVISIIIPQTLIFLFTLTFTVSSVKLFRRGILVQKTGSIPELADIDVVCFDKTGTLTTNQMFLREVAYYGLDGETIGAIYASVAKEIVGVNKTQQLLTEYFSQFKAAEVSDVVQVPFNSKQKYSLVAAKDSNGDYHQLVFGAVSALKEYFSADQQKDVAEYITLQENHGNRVLVGLYAKLNSNQDPLQIAQTNSVAVFTIEEELNLGVQGLIDQLEEQGIKVKIISGDSKNSVSRIAQKVGFNSDSLADLSEVSLEENPSLAIDKTIFTRARPEDKALIVKALRAQGYRVAMVGDGINDVLGMKAANVSIAMESGAKITREVADFVLLSNDYKQIPTIFFEGDNIIFNLKLSTKMFLAKALSGILIGLYFSLLLMPVPISPSSTLIFSFLGTSAPGYVLVFSRQRINNKHSFFRDVISSSVPAGFLTALAAVIVFVLNRDSLDAIQINTALVLVLLATSLSYSLYLVFAAGKLKSAALALLVFVYVFTIGVFQTILPIWKYPMLEKVFTALIAITGGTAVFGYFIYQGLSGSRKKKLSIITALWVVGSAVVLVFPFQSYYHVTNLPLQQLVIIGLIGLALVPIFFMFDKIVSWLKLFD